LTTDGNQIFNEISFRWFMINVPSKVRNCENAHQHQNICATKSHSRALSIFQNIGNAEKQEGI